MSGQSPEANAAHWIKTRNLTYVILVLWFIFSLAIHWVAGSLNQMTFLGFPLGYYMAVQGSLALFVIMIFVQNWRQDAIDDEYGHGE